MGKGNLLSTQTRNFIELIGNGRSYRVQPYQRDYSWGQEEWEELWNDIVALRTRTESQHYMGALVVQSMNDREFGVIDGQQRLATLSLLALAVIARLETMAKGGVDPENNMERAKELRNRFIGEKDPASLVESSRLALGETDYAIYQDYLVQLRNPLNERGLPKSNRLLCECSKYFARQIEAVEEFKRDGELLARFLSETIARQLLFILISVEDELSAYTLFETLNARGLELAVTDLLKNYLFSQVKATGDRDALRRRWKALVTTVRQEKFPEFLRYHFLCDQPKVRSKELFHLVRKYANDPDKVFALMESMEHRAELFAALSDPTHGFWAERSEARPYIRELALFKARQMVPLLFAAWEKFEPDDFVRVLRLVSIVIFRYNMVSDLNTNALEPVYHQAAKAVLTGEARTPSAVFEKLRPIYVGDEKMRQDFTLLSMDSGGQSKRLAKYILARLEGDASRRPCDWETDSATIEHILPENPSDEWDAEFPRDKWESSIYRLGNLTLLEPSSNRRIGNSNYAEKQVAYSQSAYFLTKRIAETAPDEWTPDRLNERQKKLADRAAQVWRSDFA